MRVPAPTWTTDGDAEGIALEVAAISARATKMKNSYSSHPQPEWAFEMYRLVWAEYQRAYRWKQKMQEHMQQIFMAEGDEARMRIRIDASDMAKEVLWSGYISKRIYNHVLRSAVEIAQEESEYDRERLEDEMDYARNL